MDIAGMTGDVKKMYDIVVKGRMSPRVYSEVNVEVVHLKTMKDMEEFFSTFWWIFKYTWIKLRSGNIRMDEKR